MVDDLHSTLRAQRDDIAQSWTSALAHGGYAAWSSRELRERLAALVDQAIDVLSGVSDLRLARAIGAGLAQLGYTSPEVLGRTIELLGQQFLTRLPAAATPAVQGRLTGLLGELSTGFAEELRRGILGEQEAIHQALIAPGHKAEQ